jgi:hypothetical protein
VLCSIHCVAVAAATADPADAHTARAAARAAIAN